MLEAYDRLALSCAQIALEAAVPVLDIYTQDFSARQKADGTPVTDADLAADQIIHDRLQHFWPDIPVISEEREHSGAAALSRYFLVDPVDGTREFLNRTGEFTINIALIENGRAKAGAIYAPAIGSLFIGGEHASSIEHIKPNDKAEPDALKPIAIRKADPSHVTVLASLSHGDATTDSFIANVGHCATKRAGSSLKFCVIAKGEADFYPRFGPTMGWDIAAGDAILNAAGGCVMAANGEPISYDIKAMRNGPFLAIGDRDLVTTLKPEFIRAVQNQRHAKTGIVG